MTEAAPATGGYNDAMNASVAIVLGSLALGAPTGLRAQDTLGMRWHTDLAAAREQAIAQQKPLLLLFRCER